MIKSFKGEDAESLFKGSRVRQWVNIEKFAMRQLAMLNRAATLEDLRVPPSNRLEKLSGDREGLWSIRINDQFRICFLWLNNDAFNVEIVDYH